MFQCFFNNKSIGFANTKSIQIRGGLFRPVFFMSNIPPIPCQSLVQSVYNILPVAFLTISIRRISNRLIQSFSNIILLFSSCLFSKFFSLLWKNLVTMSEYSIQPRTEKEGKNSRLREELSSIAFRSKRRVEVLGEKGLRGNWVGKN